MNTDRNVLMASDGRVLSLPTDGVALPLGSGPHCRVTRTAQGFQLEVLVEATVNGQEVRKKLLQEGDVVLTDGQRFTFTAAAAPAKTTARVTQRTTATQAQAGAAPARNTQRTTATGNTQRTTAAAPAAAAGNTARTTRTTTTANTTRTAAPAGNGNTARMAAAGPAGPTTARTTRMTQRTTARNTTRTTGMFPSGAAQKKRFMRNLIIAGSVVGGLALIGGVLLYLNSKKLDPDQIKKELAAAIEEINKIPEDEDAKKLQLVQQLLNEQKYRDFAKAMYANLEKQAELLKERVRARREADAEVLPYVQEVDRARALGPDAFADQAQDLYDKVKALIDRHGTSHHGPKLIALQKELLDILNRPSSPWQRDIITLRRDTRELGLDKGDFVGAFKLIDEFGVKYKEGSDNNLAKALTQVREQTGRFVEDYLKKLERKVVQLRQESKADEAKKALEEARPGLKGIREGMDKLEDLIRKYQ